MSLPLIVTLCFAGFTLAVAAVAMLIRDLVFAGREPQTVSLVDRSRTIRRALKTADAAPKSLTARLDQGFDRLVLESGVALSSLSAALGCVASGLLIGGFVFLALDHPAAALTAAAVGMSVPVLVLAVKRSRRMRRFRDEMPQLLDLLSRSARAGRSLEQSFTLAAQEMRGGLGKELDLCVKQLEMGRSFEAVMKSLASRVRLLEVRILATTLIVQRQSGGNLPETLDRMSAVVRDRLFAQKRMRSATSAGRTSALMIAAICPLAYLVMFVLQPEHVRILIDDPFGQLLLTTAAVLELAGMFWVAQLLKQES